MGLDSQRRKIASILATADIHIDGDQPWDMRVYDKRFYGRVLAEGTLGVGEAYMEGWWDCPALDQLICRAIRARLHEQLKPWRLIGASINLGIYVLVIELIPALAAVPVLPLAAGAVVALLANFLLVRRYIFRNASEPDAA